MNKLLDTGRGGGDALLTFSADRTEELPHCCPPAPVVSVCVQTYNHGKYIRQAIESVLAQQTDFPIELVIGEDCSTDGTRDIVLDYHARYPEKIRGLLSTENLGKYTGNGRLNLIRNLQACRGDYIAFLDGDDYWIDSSKLQKQVAVLQEDTDCTLCFHSAVEQRNGVERLYRPPVIQDTYGAEDLFAENFIRSCTVMYRNILKGAFPEWFYSIPFGDWPLHLLHAVEGHIRYIDDPMACYRVHAGGFWSSENYVVNLEKTIQLCVELMDAFPRETHKDLPRKAIVKSRCDIVRYCLVWGNRPNYGRRHLVRALLDGGMPAEDVSQFVRLLLWTFLPWAGRIIQKQNRDEDQPSRA